MAATRTPGITIDTEGNYFIDKCHRGTRICVRLGQTTTEQAEVRLKREVAHVDMDLARRAHARPLFRDCAARYLAQRHERRSLATKCFGAGHDLSASLISESPELSCSRASRQPDYEHPQAMRIKGDHDAKHFPEDAAG